MNPVQITGIGWVTAGGMGCARERDDFVMPNGTLPEIKPESCLSKPFPYFRRMDAYSRLGLIGIALALKDANLEHWTEKRNIGIIVSSHYGCLQTDVDYFETVKFQNGIGASPALFSYTLPSVFLGEAAIRFGLTGPTFVINSVGPMGRAGLQAALESIAAGETDKILCGVCDLNDPPLAGISSPFPPGAVFLVFERCPLKSSDPYGSVSLNSKGRVLLNEAEVRDIPALVQKCLAECRLRP